jgi:hypothetical protein
VSVAERRTSPLRSHSCDALTIREARSDTYLDTFFTTFSDECSEPVFHSVLQHHSHEVQANPARLSLPVFGGLSSVRVIEASQAKILSQSDDPCGCRIAEGSMATQYACNTWA